MSEGIWTIGPCPHRQASALASALGLSEITASVLVRRGYGDPDEARAFLAGEQPLHDPFLLGDMSTAVERIRAAIGEGRRICVHGDYDVDGICATVLAVLVLHELGADVEWHLPSRFDEGYGVSGETLERLAGEG
jgi:single-stranded-DNA-specific exonuclease